MSNKLNIIRLGLCLAFVIFILSSIFVVPVSAAGTISAGPQTITPTTNGGPLPGRTIIITNEDYLGNGTGWLTSVTTSAYNGYPLTGTWVGTFYYVAGPNVWKCRDAVFLGTCAGLKTTDITATPLFIRGGDSLGIYYTSGYMTLNQVGNATWESWFTGGNRVVEGMVSDDDDLTPSGSSIAFGAVGYGIATGLPFGECLDAGNITATSATLNGHCISDGDEDTTALFMYGAPSQDGNKSVEGYVINDQYFQVSVTGLIPDQTYGFWIVFTNANGEYWTNPICYFNTLEAPEAIQPIVVTNPVNPVLDVSETGASLHGYLTYDGNLDCQVGFRWRVKGTSTWSLGWNSTSQGWWHTGMQIRGTLTNLVKNTTYEFSAIAKNAMSAPGGYSYGSTLEFKTTYYTAPTPTTAGDTGGLSPLIPENIRNYFTNMSSLTKMYLAIIITIGGLFCLPLTCRSSKARLLLSVYS